MKLFTKVRQHVLINGKYYSAVIIAFFSGCLVAAFSAFSMPEADKNELMLYLNDFFKNISATGTDGLSVFKLSVFGNIKEIGVIMLFSLMIIGAPFLLVISAVNGYTVAFTLCFFIKAYGIKAILFFVAACFPHWVINAPSYAFLLSECLEFSLSVSGKLTPRKQKISVLNFLVAVFAVLFFTICSSLLQGYVEPWLISFISKYYIQ